MPARPRRPTARVGSSRRGARAALGAALVALAVYAWWPAARVAPPPLDAAREIVVFLGDSITAGHGLSREVAFPHQLGEALGVSVVNAGISGDTTADGLARLERDVLSRRPKLVVIELGANDVLRRLPREQALTNLRTIVRRVREDGAGVLLLHIRLGAFGGDAYGDGFRAIARDEGTWLYEDFLDGVVPGLTTDGLHPTAEGHARLAARLEPVLRDILAR